MVDCMEASRVHVSKCIKNPHDIRANGRPRDLEEACGEAVGTECLVWWERVNDRPNFFLYQMFT
jgi:hypothetical protein